MLSERVKKARNIVEAGLVHQIRDGAWWVPGSDGKRYLVTRRKRELRYRCELDCGGHGYTPCLGNSNGFCCYHVFQAIIASAAKKGVKVSFCRTETEAKLLSRLNGKVYQVRSAQGSGRVFVVVS